MEQADGMAGRGSRVEAAAASLRAVERHPNSWAMQPLSFRLLLVLLAAFYYITAFAFISDLPPSRNS